MKRTRCICPLASPARQGEIGARHLPRGRERGLSLCAPASRRKKSTVQMTTATTAVNHSHLRRLLDPSPSHHRRLWPLLETNRISAVENPTLSTSVVVPGGLPRANPVSAMPKSIRKDKTKQIEYNIKFITLIRVHLIGTCRVQVHRD
jgi:hypothetical protein